MTTLFTADKAREMLQARRARAVARLEHDVRMGFSERARYLGVLLTVLQNSVEDGHRTIQHPLKDSLVKETWWLRMSLDVLGFKSMVLDTAAGPCIQVTFNP